MTFDFEPISTSDLPRAHSTKLYFCGHCPNGHLVLIDADGCAIAQAVVSYDQFVAMASKVLLIQQSFESSGDHT